MSSSLRCATACAIALTACVPRAVPPASPVAPPPPPPITAAYLEAHVPDAVFAQGLALSREGMRVQIQPRGDRWDLALVDLYTGEPRASATLALPAGRDAAVATVAGRVPRLLDQAKGLVAPDAPDAAPEPAAAPSTSAESSEPPSPPAEELRAVAEARYAREAIQFGTEPVVSDGATITQPRWQIYQGDPSHEMSPRRFYRAIERPELYAAYTHRRSLALFSYTLSGALLLSGAIVRAWGSHEDRIASTTLFITGALAGAAGVTFSALRHPLDVDDAKALADAYNRRLRGKLGLPAEPPSPVIGALRIAPYAAATGGGVAIGGGF